MPSGRSAGIVTQMSVTTIGRSALDLLINLPRRYVLAATVGAVVGAVVVARAQRVSRAHRADEVVMPGIKPWPTP